MSATNIATAAAEPILHSADADTIPSSQVVWPASRSKRVSTIGFGLGAVGIIATLIGAQADPIQGYGSYLTAYMLFLSLGLGGLFFVMIHHLTSARWSVTVRRLSEAVMGTLPVFALLFIPVALGMTTLFEWANPAIAAGDELIQEKSPYLNVTFFAIRAVFYFVVWTVLSIHLARKSAQQDHGDGPKILAHLRAVSAPGMILFGLTLTFAAFDWLMSMSAHWFSTIFGVYYFAGAFQGVLALLIVVAMLLQRAGLLQGLVTVEHYHDLGKLLFGFTVFFAYIGFCQYFLIWYANIPEETFWFTARWDHGWAPISLAMIAFTFVFPFFWLLSRNVKRHLGALLFAAIVVLIGRFIDVYWMVMPSLDHHHPVGPQLSWTIVTALLGIGGVFVGMLAWRLGKNPLIPIGDPHLRSSLGHENV